MDEPKSNIGAMLAVPSLVQREDPHVRAGALLPASWLEGALTLTSHLI